MKRFGQTIKLKPGCYEEYKKYHQEVWPEVLKQIADCNIKNYSIYHFNGVLFAYFEYHGTSFEADMQKMSAHPKTQEWWAIMEPIQEPLPERKQGDWWLTLEEVFHTD